MRGRGVTGSEKLDHVFCRLLKIGSPIEGGKRNVFGEEIHFQNVKFCMCVRKIAAPAAVMLKSRADIPADATVITEGGARGSRDVSHNFCAGGCERSAIEVECSVEGSISRQCGMNTRGTK